MTFEFSIYPSIEIIKDKELIVLKTIRNYYLISGKAYNFTCRTGWSDRHDEYCYMKFLGIRKNWHDARRICHFKGGFLVGIRNWDTQRHIEGSLLKRF